MWFGPGLIALVIPLAIGFRPDGVAGRTGHGLIGDFSLSLLFPIRPIVAYTVKHRAPAAIGPAGRAAGRAAGAGGCNASLTIVTEEGGYGDELS